MKRIDFVSFFFYINRQYPVKFCLTDQSGSFRIDPFKELKAPRSKWDSNSNPLIRMMSAKLLYHAYGGYGSDDLSLHTASHASAIPDGYDPLDLSAKDAPCYRVQVFYPYSGPRGSWILGEGKSPISSKVAPMGNSSGGEDIFWRAYRLLEGSTMQQVVI